VRGHPVSILRRSDAGSVVQVSGVWPPKAQCIERSACQPAPEVGVFVRRLSDVVSNDLTQTLHLRWWLACNAVST
jgi:hypothetical protein